MGTNAVFKGPASQAVAANVKEVRDRRGWSQADLAARMTTVGRSTQASAVAKVESGDRRVDVDELVILAAVLNVSIARLLVGAPSNPGAMVRLLPNEVTDASSAWAWATGGGPLSTESTVPANVKAYWDYKEEQPKWVLEREADDLLRSARALEDALAPLARMNQPLTEQVLELRLKQARARLADVETKLSEIEMEGGRG